MITTILKGDPSADIQIRVPETASCFVVEYQGIVRRYIDVSANQTLILSFSASETECFQLGTYPVKTSCAFSNGRSKSYPLGDKIKVTDCPSEVYSPSASISPASIPEDVASSDSLGDLKSKMNTLLQALRAGACLIIVSAAASLSGSVVHTAELNSISGNASVVTNVDLTGYVTISTLENTVNSTVTNTAAYVVSNIVDRSYVEGLGIESGTDPEIISQIAQLSTNVNTKANASSVYTRTEANNMFANKNEIPDITSKADKSSVEGVSNRVESIGSNVASWSNYWSGDDVRVTVTNYYGTQDIPRLYIEEKVSDSGTNYFRTVWDEMTRWNQFLPTYRSFTNSVTTSLAGKADRAWGYYDSHMGAYAPDGYTWISSPHVAIAGGLAYQRTITSDGSVFVLCSNGLVTQTGGTVSNGFFRVSDDEGNSIFEIVKGDKRTAGALPSSTVSSQQAGVTHISVLYEVDSDNHPVAYFTSSLDSPNWKSETDADCLYNVSWSGSSGEWTLEFWPKTSLASGFVKAEYEVGGNTRIRQNAIVEMSKIYLNGVEYNIGTANISGNTVLTLTPSN